MLSSTVVVFVLVDLLISNKCIEDLFDVQAIKWRVGWKMILVMKAFPEPRLSS